MNDRRSSCAEICRAFYPVLDCGFRVSLELCMWNCSHSDSCRWNPIKLRLWHSPPHASKLWERYPDSIQQLREFTHQLDIILTRLFSPLSFNAVVPASMPSSRKRYLLIRKSSPTSLPLSSACRLRLWPRPRAETPPARPTSCEATLSGCRPYRPTTVTISCFIWRVDAGTGGIDGAP